MSSQPLSTERQQAIILAQCPILPRQYPGSGVHLVASTQPQEAPVQSLTGYAPVASANCLPLKYCLSQQQNTTPSTYPPSAVFIAPQINQQTIHISSSNFVPQSVIGVPIGMAAQPGFHTCISPHHKQHTSLLITSHSPATHVMQDSLLGASTPSISRPHTIAHQTSIGRGFGSHVFNLPLAATTNNAAYVKTPLASTRHRATDFGNQTQQLKFITAEITSPSKTLITNSGMLDNASDRCSQGAQKITRLSSVFDTTKKFRLSHPISSTQSLAFLPSAPKRPRFSDVRRPVWIVSHVCEDRIPCEYATCFHSPTADLAKIGYYESSLRVPIISGQSFLCNTVCSSYNALFQKAFISNVSATEFSVAAVSETVVQNEVYEQFPKVSIYVNANFSCSLVPVNIEKPVSPSTSNQTSSDALIKNALHSEPMAAGSHFNNVEVNARDLPPDNKDVDFRRRMSKFCPFMHCFNLVLPTIIPRRPFGSSSSEALKLISKFDPKPAHNLRSSCQLLVQLGRSLVEEQYKNHFQSYTHRRLRGLKATKRLSKSNASRANHPSNASLDCDEPGINDVESSVENGLPESTFIHHLVWCRKKLGKAQTSTCFTNACPYVGASFLSLSRHLEHGHYVMTLVNDPSRLLDLRADDMITVGEQGIPVMRTFVSGEEAKYSCRMCMKFFVTAKAAQSHMMKVHNSSTFSAADFGVTTTCWNCTSNIDRNQHLPVCNLLPDDDRLAVIDLLASDPARAINSHVVAALILSPNPDSLFSLPAELATRLQPVDKLDLLSDNYSFRYNRAISALHGVMQPCLKLEEAASSKIVSSTFDKVDLNFICNTPPLLPKHKVLIPQGNPMVLPLLLPSPNIQKPPKLSAGNLRPLFASKSQRSTRARPQMTLPVPGSKLPIPRLFIAPSTVNRSPIHLQPGTDSVRLPFAPSFEIQLAPLDASKVPSQSFPNLPVPHIIPYRLSPRNWVRLDGQGIAGPLTQPQYPLVAHVIRPPIMNTQRARTTAVPAFSVLAFKRASQPFTLPVSQQLIVPLSSTDPTFLPVSTAAVTLNTLPAIQQPDRTIPTVPHLVCPICAFSSLNRAEIMQHILDAH